MGDCLSFQTMDLSCDYAQNKDLVADAQTLLEENLSEKKSVESARRLAERVKQWKDHFVLLASHQE